MKTRHFKEFMIYMLKTNKISLFLNVLAVSFLYFIAYFFYKLSNGSVIFNMIVVTIASILFTFFIFKSVYIEHLVYKREIIKNKLNICYYDNRVPIVGSRDVYFGIELYDYLVKNKNEVILKSINPILSNKLKPLDYSFNNPNELINNIHDIYN